jgi:hypothetical protein
MVKVLLVFEEFNEMSLTETSLKKIGFDVTGITNEVLLSEKLLSFNPDVVVGFGKNSRVSSFSVGQKMRENHRFQGKVLIVVPKGVRPSPQEIMKMKMDGILEAPIELEKMIHIIARLSGQSADGYLEKLHKARLGDASDGSRRPTSLSPVNPSAAAIVPPSSMIQGAQKSFTGPELAPSSYDDPERIKKYLDMSQGLQVDLKQSTHTKVALKRKQDDLKKTWDFNKLDDLDKLKREFASALFRKQK